MSKKRYPDRHRRVAKCGYSKQAARQACEQGRQRRSIPSEKILVFPKGRENLRFARSLLSDQQI
jgi:hypothetical protein